MKILAIETSCDDTCISIIKIKNLPRTEPKVLVRGQKSPKGSLRLPAGQAKIKSFDVLSSIVSSQVKLHSKYGGVYPTLAKREHQRNLVPVLKQALLEARLLKLKISARGGSAFGGKNQKSKLKFKIKNLKKILEREEILYKQLEKFLEKHGKPDIDLIAVTVGPGLEPCLWVGINFAKTLSYFWNLPIIPVNHIEAHIMANFIGQTQNSKLKTQNFPAICLVVSGGHTQLILMSGLGKYKIIGETRDDAAGECFDKVARILGLGYPGGPAIAAEAAKFSIFNFQFSIKLPRPMMYTKDYDFSFSGLKTAVLYQYKKSEIKNQKYKQEMCHETQQAIIDVLIHKTLKAAKDFKAKSIILGGGVTANSELRKQFGQKIKTLKPKPHLFIPAKNLSTDNAAMVGALACYWRKSPPHRRVCRRGAKTKKWQEIEAKANLSI